MAQPAPPKRTMFAQQAVDFSDYFDMMFAKTVVGGEVVRRVTLAAPEGMSTGGGKQAVQHILLKAEGGGGRTLTVGSVDRAAGLVKLRTWELLAYQHRQRFGEQTPFGVDRVQYEAFFDQARKFFDQEKLPVKVENAPVGAVTPARRRGLSLPLVIGLLVVLLLVVAAATAGVVYLLRG